MRRWSFKKTWGAHRIHIGAAEEVFSYIIWMCLPKVPFFGGGGGGGLFERLRLAHCRVMGSDAIVSFQFKHSAMTTTVICGDIVNGARSSYYFRSVYVVYELNGGSARGCVTERHKRTWKGRK